MKQYIILLGVFLLLSLQAKALSGGDVTRAALFTTYAKQAKQTLLAQKKAMGLNLTGYKFLKEEMEEITDFQKQFNDYLDSFGDILSIAAEAYGIYFEVDQAFKNIRQLKQTSVVHSKMIFLVCYLLDYQQVHDNANVSIILLGDKKEPTK